MWWLINLDWSSWAAFVTDMYNTARANIALTPPPNDAISQRMNVNITFGPISINWTVVYAIDSTDIIIDEVNCDSWDVDATVGILEFTADSFSGSDTDCVSSPGIPGSAYPSYSPSSQYWVHRTGVPNLSFPGTYDFTYESNYDVTHTAIAAGFFPTDQPLGGEFDFTDSSVGDRGSSAPLGFLLSAMIPSAGVWSGSDYTSLGDLVL